MQWSAVTWRSANPIRPAGARTPVVPWRPVHPVFNRTLPQALPEASSSVSPVSPVRLIDRRIYRFWCPRIRPSFRQGRRSLLV
jgi:hypothetical protein